MRRSRILVLTKTTAMGGAERLLLNALPYLDRETYDYRFSALDEDGPLAAACRDEDVPFHRLAHPRALDPRNVRALRRTLVDETIDLVHVHLPLMGALARMAARGLRTQVVYTEHNLQDRYRAPSRWLNAATYAWQERVVAVSREVRSSAEARIGAAARARTTVVPNGVDFDRLDREAAARPLPGLPRRPRGTFLVLVPASLAWRKGQDVLLDALESLGEQPFPPLHAWLAGEGPERRHLEARIRSGILSGRVHLLGQRRDVFSLMRLADAVVLPSRYEGHPLALLESLALGRPAIATSVGGVPEIIAPNQTGLLVPPENPEALARAIARLRGDPEVRGRLGINAARDARRRFDVRRSVKSIEAIYQSCLEPGRAVLEATSPEPAPAQVRSPRPRPQPPRASP